VVAVKRRGRFLVGIEERLVGAVSLFMLYCTIQGATES